MQFNDLKYQYKTIQTPINNAILGVLHHGQYILGPEVFELESKLALYTKTKFCVSCSSGTDALLMSLMAADIGPGDAIFTSPFTFIATANSVKYIGGKVITADIDEETYCISPKEIEKVKTSQEKT